MADEKRDAPRPFDVRTVEYLLKLMTEHDLAEVELREGDQRIRLRKGTAIPAGFLPAPAYPNPHPNPAPANPGVHAPAPPPLAPAKNYIEIKSEIPGTFYTRPAPGKPEYVSKGSKVMSDTTVCLIMAMKVENPIKAGVAGTIVEIVAKNEQFVDFGTVLFLVDPG